MNAAGSVRLTWAALALFVCTRARAERALTLDEALSRALDHNPALASTFVDLRQAQARVLEASGAEDFVLTAAATDDLLRGAGLPGLTSDEWSARLSLARLLPTGGTLSLQLDSEYTRSLSAPSGSAEVYAPSVTLSLTQPLLRGFGPKVTRAARARAKVDLDRASLRRDAALLELVRAVSEAYWELAFATVELRVRKASLELAREQLRAVQAHIDVGKQPPSAAAEVEVTIALREDDLVQSEEALTLRSLELGQLLGVQPSADGAPLVPSSPLEPRVEPQGGAAIDAFTRRALADNPLVALARADERGAAIELEVARNARLPALDVTFGGGPAAVDSSAREGFAGLGHGYRVQAGLSFSLPVENRAASGQYAAAKEGVRKALLSAQATSIALAASVTRATTLLLSAEKRIGVLSRASELAALDLEAERARFQVGRSSNFDVLRRQDELARAQLNQARAKADTLVAQALVDALTGRNLERLHLAARGGGR